LCIACGTGCASPGSRLLKSEWPDRKLGDTLFYVGPDDDSGVSHYSDFAFGHRATVDAAKFERPLGWLAGTITLRAFVARFDDVSPGTLPPPSLADEERHLRSKLDLLQFFAMQKDGLPGFQFEWREHPSVFETDIRCVGRVLVGARRMYGWLAAFPDSPDHWRTARTIVDRFFDAARISDSPPAGGS
jgi:hypothetical protein